MPFSDTITNLGEKEYAQYLESQNIRYYHQPDYVYFSNKKGDRYRPDFYLPKTGTYVEVTNDEGTFKSNVHKYKKMLIEQYKFRIVLPNGNEYVDSDFIRNYTKKSKLPKSFYSIRIKIPYNLKISFQKYCINHNTDMSKVLRDFIETTLDDSILENPDEGEENSHEWSIYYFNIDLFNIATNSNRWLNQVSYKTYICYKKA